MNQDEEEDSRGESARADDAFTTRSDDEASRNVSNEEETTTHNHVDDAATDEVVETETAETAADDSLEHDGGITRRSERANNASTTDATKSDQTGTSNEPSTTAVAAAVEHERTVAEATAGLLVNSSNNINNSNNSRTFAQDRIAAKYAAFARNVGSSQVGESTTNDPAPTTTDTNTSITSATTATSAPISAPTASSAPTSANATEGVSNNSRTFAQDRIAAKYAAFARNVEPGQVSESTTSDPAPTTTDTNTSTTSTTTSASTSANATEGVSNNSSTFAQDRIAAKYAAFARNVGADQAAAESNTDENERVASSANNSAQDRVAAKHTAFAANTGGTNDERMAAASGTTASGARVAADVRNGATPTTGEGDSTTAEERLARLRRARQGARQTPGVRHVPRRAPGLPVMSSSRRLARIMSRRRRMSSEVSSPEVTHHVVPQARLVEPEPVLEYVTAVEATPWIKERKTVITLVLLCLAVTGITVSLYIALRPPRVCPNGSFSSPREALGDEITDIIDQSNDASSPYYKALEWIEKSHSEKDLCSSYAMRQRYISALLYYNNNGIGWDQSHFFLLDKSVCYWNTGVMGLFCDNNDNITRIVLYNNNLEGSIPPEIGYLTNLKELSLHGNLYMNGTIPCEIGNLTRLQTLSLDGENMDGTIPTQFGNLVELDELDLGAMSLTGTVPTEIGNLKNLTHLDLFENDLNGTIPSELGSLSKLDYLAFSWNRLTGTIPSELGNLSKVQQLELDHNFLNGTIPSEIGNLDRLYVLYMGSNNLSGTIPSKIFFLTGLSILHLASNFLSGIVPFDEINPETSQSQLEELDLSNNNLNGTIPTQLGKIEMLESLNLELNQLTGTIPTELGATNSLEFLYLCCNRLEGVFPPQEGDTEHSSSFSVVEIFSNNITGDLSFLCDNDHLRLKVDCEHHDGCECCKCGS